MLKVGQLFSAFVLTLALLGVGFAGNASDPAQRGAILKGHFTQGGLLMGSTEPGAIVKLDGRDIRVSNKGDFLIGFGRDAKLNWRLVVQHPDGPTYESSIEITPRKYNVQRIDGLPPSKVTPSAEDIKRIQADTAQIRKARAIDDVRTDFLGPIDWPVYGIITGVYGSQRILNGEPRRPHYGIDIHAPTGTAVRAPAPGVVTVAHPDMFFSGATMIIDHGHGLSSTFLHLDEMLVAVGDLVEKNQVVATVGSSGRSTGPHLDWRLNLFSTRLDPQLIAGEMPKTE